MKLNVQNIPKILKIQAVQFSNVSINTIHQREKKINKYNPKILDLLKCKSENKIKEIREDNEIS